MKIKDGRFGDWRNLEVMGKLPYTVIRDGIFAHPTLAESLNNLFMAMDGQGLHEEK